MEMAAESFPVVEALSSLRGGGGGAGAGASRILHDVNSFSHDEHDDTVVNDAPPDTGNITATSAATAADDGQWVNDMTVTLTITAVLICVYILVRKVLDKYGPHGRGRRGGEGYETANPRSTAMEDREHRVIVVVNKEGVKLNLTARQRRAVLETIFAGGDDKDVEPSNELLKDEEEGKDQKKKEQEGSETNEEDNADTHSSVPMEVSLHASDTTLTEASSFDPAVDEEAGLTVLSPHSSEHGGDGGDKKLYYGSSATTTPLFMAPDTPATHFSIDSDSDSDSDDGLDMVIAHPAGLKLPVPYDEKEHDMRSSRSSLPKISPRCGAGQVALPPPLVPSLGGSIFREEEKTTTTTEEEGAAATAGTEEEELQERMWEDEEVGSLESVPAGSDAMTPKDCGDCGACVDDAPVDEEKAVVTNKGTDNTPSDDDGQEGDNDCAICLCDYEDDEIVVKSNHCEHRFHKECLLEWLDKHDDCPICRVEMVTQTDLLKAAETALGNEKIRFIDNREAQPRSALTPALLANSSSVTANSAFLSY